MSDCIIRRSDYEILTDPDLRPAIEARFWPKVQKSDGCWVWMASRAPTGYGYFGIQTRRGIGEARRSAGAHRIAWMLLRGAIPDGLCVLHNCPGGDNPSCVNPAHLFLGTQLDNIQDRERKGRSASGSIRASRGEKNGFSKLTTDEVLRMRTMHRTLAVTTTHLSEVFGISSRRVREVIKGNAWAHVGNDYHRPSSTEFDLTRELREVDR